MADSYYDFMMRQPGIASSLVSGVAATRDAQNKERLRQAAAAMKKRLLEETQRSAELDRIQSLSNDLSLAPEQMAAAGAKANEGASSQDARYTTDLDETRKKFESATKTADELTAAIPVGQESQEGWKALLKSEEAKTAATNLGRSLVTPIPQLAKKRELTQDEFDDKLNRTYHKTEDVDTVTQNRGAFVDPDTGSAYASHGAYKAEKARQQRSEARSKATEKKAKEIKALRDKHTIKVADLQALKAKAPDILKRMGIEEKDITPEMLDQVTAKFSEQLEQEQAEYQQALSEATLGGTKKAISKAAAAKLTPMKERVDALLALNHKASGAGATYKQAWGALEKSIDEDARQLLQEIMVNNPIADRPDPRVDEDRRREKAIEARLPEIAQLQSVDPEGSKVFMDLLKQESKQGDAGLEAERKAVADRLKSNTQLLASYEQGEKRFQYQAEQVAISKRKLDQAQQKLDDAKTVNERKLAQRDRDLANKEYDTDIKLYMEMGRNNRNMRDNKVKTFVGAANSPFVETLQDYLEVQQESIVDPSIPKNADEVLKKLQQGGMQFSASAPVLRTKKEPGESRFDKSKLTNEEVPQTDPLPPLEGEVSQPAPAPGPGKGGAAKPRKAKLRTETNPQEKPKARKSLRSPEGAIVVPKTEAQEKALKAMGYVND